AEDGIRDRNVTGVQTCALPILFSLEEAYACYCRNEVPVTMDAEASTIKTASPAVVVDAILAKRNLGTSITDAPVVVGVGPGFTSSEERRVGKEGNGLWTSDEIW